MGGGVAEGEENVKGRGGDGGGGGGEGERGWIDRTLYSAAGTMGKVDNYGCLELEP